MRFRYINLVLIPIILISALVVFALISAMSSFVKVLQHLGHTTETTIVLDEVK
jgi:uncharacterized membrane protein YqhA